MHSSSIIAVFFYIGIIVSIGIIASHKNKSASAYLLGGRGLNYWVAAISANASDMSIWLFMGLPMAIFDVGMNQAYMAIGLILFMFLNWHFVAPRLRRLTEEYQAITLLSFFEKKLGNEAKSLRVTGAVFTTIFLTLYVAVGITGMGYLFESIFGLQYALGCTFSVVCVLLYIGIGGFTAICYADFAQGIFLMAVVILVPSLVLIFPTEGHNNLVGLQNILAEPFLPTDGESLFSALSLALGWGVGYFGQPHILNKFMAIRNASDLTKSKWIGTAWQILALAGSVSVGIAAHYFFFTEPLNSELIFVDIVKALFSPFFASLILCAILAATLSTVDSQVIVIASALANDIFAPVAKNHASDKNILLISRLSIVAVCAVALSIALLSNTAIFATVYYCWVGMGATFGPMVIASLYFKRLTIRGAQLGMLFGGMVGLLWILLDTKVSATIPGMIVGLFTIWWVSRTGKSFSTPVPPSNKS